MILLKAVFAHSLSKRLLMSSVSMKTLFDVQEPLTLLALLVRDSDGVEGEV